MLEKLTYINHLGESLDFGDYAECLYVDPHELRDYSWEINQVNGKITGFRKKVRTTSLPVMIATNNKSYGFKLRDIMFETFEKDILANKTGKIKIGDYFLDCNVYESKKADWVYSPGFIRFTLGVVAENPNWYRDYDPISFVKGGLSESNIDYPYDYPYEYSMTTGRSIIESESVYGNDFTLTIEGPCENPTIEIGGHTYKINHSLDSNEYAVVDSMNKTLYKVNKLTNEITDLFKYRYKPESIFEKIPDGASTVFWDGSFSFYIAIHEERSEPKWGIYSEETKEDVVSGYELLDSNGEFVLDSKGERIEVAG